jgi:hypothetical protein
LLPFTERRKSKREREVKKEEIPVSGSRGRHRTGAQLRRQKRAWVSVLIYVL